MELQQKTDPEMLRYWVWLSLVFGAGSTKLLQYVRHAESPQEIYDGMQAGVYRDLPDVVQRAMTKHSLGEADGIVYFCHSHDFRLLPFDSTDYPPALRNITTPPVLLTAKGCLDLLSNPLSLAVVGTRRPSPYTERVTQQIVTELSKQGFVIVSGFAKGVDGIAHKAALDAGGTTIAVLGCGLNVNYPREHDVLRDRLLSSGRGLLLSEYLPGTQPHPGNFPRRNRILSGLCDATAVMEASLRSGSLSTAQHATEQGRFLFCVPPADIFDARYQGSVRLLRDHVIPLMSHEDILLAFYTRYPQLMTEPEFGLRNSERLVYPEYRHEKLPEKNAAEADAPEHPLPRPVPDEPAAPDEKEMPLPESEAGREIVLYLRERGDTHADEIAAALDMDLSTLLSELTMLELDGFVEALFGKYFRAC